MKRIIIFSILLITIFLVRTHESHASIPILIINDGDLISSQNDSAIYLISERTKRVFPHIAVYQSWGYPEDFSTVKIIAEDKLNNYVYGEPVPFRDGTLFRGTATSLHGKDSSAVFVVSDGKLRPINSGEIYKALYNDLDYSKVTWVPDDLLNKFEYPLGESVDSSENHPNGSLIQYNGSPNLYLVRNGEKRMISSSALTSNRLRKTDIILVNAEQYEYNNGLEVTGEERILADPTYSSIDGIRQKPIIENIFKNQLHLDLEKTTYKYNLTVEASDLDGYSLNYQWYADCGYFYGNTDIDSVEWRYPVSIDCDETWITVTVTDEDGLSTMKTQNIFSLENAPEPVDLIAPKIFNTGIIEDPIHSSVLVVWTTDELSNSVVEYNLGTTNTYIYTQRDESNVIEHEVKLSNLIKNRNYSYRVCSTDIDSNTTCGLRKSFQAPSGTPGTITIEESDDTPDSEIIIIGESNKIISKIKFTADNDDITINKIKIGLGVNGGTSVNKISISYPGHTASGDLLIGVINAYTNFSGLQWLIKSGESEILTLSADLTDSLVANQTGSEIQMGVISIEATGYNTDLSRDVNVFGNKMYLRKSKPTIALVDLEENKLINGITKILRFSVTAGSNGPVTIKKFTFDVDINFENSQSIASNWQLYKIENTERIINGTWAEYTGIENKEGNIPLSRGNHKLLFEFDNEIEIQAGQSKEFEVRSFISSVQEDDSIRISLTNNNDTDLISGGLVDSSSNLVMIDDGSKKYSIDFLWSDKSIFGNHTDAYQNDYKDWTNGYLVEGLPTEYVTLIYPE